MQEKTEALLGALTRLEKSYRQRHDSLVRGGNGTGSDIDCKHGGGSEEHKPHRRQRRGEHGHGGPREHRDRDTYDYHRRFGHHGEGGRAGKMRPSVMISWTPEAGRALWRLGQFSLGGMVLYFLLCLLRMRVRKGRHLK